MRLFISGANWRVPHPVIRRVALAAALLFLPALRATGQEFRLTTVEPDGGSTYTETGATDVSRGGIVLGRTTYQGATHQYTWTVAAGFQLIPAPVYYLTNDLGDRFSDSYALLAGATTAVEIPTPDPAYPLVAAFDSNDSRTVVGLTNKGPPSTGIGMDRIPIVWDPVNGSRTFAVPDAKELVAVNIHGVAVGHRRIRSGFDLAFVIDLQTGAWIDLAGMLPLDAAGFRHSTVVDINDNGVVLGHGYTGPDYNPFLWDPVNGFTLLPGLNGGDPLYVTPTALDNQQRVVGGALDGNDDPRAFIWTAADGMRDLNTLHDDLAGDYLLTKCRDISETGVIAGFGHHGPGWGPNRAFILEPNGPWMNLGHGLAGTGGVVPRLTGTGSLQPGTPASLTLQDALPGSQAWLFLGLSELNAPFKGGTLVPATDYLFSRLPVNGAGELVIGTNWPAAPSGTSIYFQYWVVDPAAPFGASASNGLAGTTP